MMMAALVVSVTGCAMILAGWAMYLGVRWPWVSRVAYDDMVSAHAAERENARKLQRIIIRLKVSGQAHLPTKVEARVAQREDRIEKVIARSKHAKNPAIRTALRNFADGEVAKGTDVDEILTKLENWDRVDTLRDEEDDDDDGKIILS